MTQTSGQNLRQPYLCPCFPSPWITLEVDGAIHGRKPTFDCHASTLVLCKPGGRLSMTARVVAATSPTYVSPLATTFMGREWAVNRMTTCHQDQEHTWR